MGDSAIEWTDYTWNPVTGCSKVSQGCHFCYAERLWPKVSAAEAKRLGTMPRPFTDVRTHPERLSQPLRLRRPRRIFVNSMSDLFHEDVPREFVELVFSTMAAAKRHTFQVLTKRPERMRALMSGDILSIPLPNVWLGVSVEDQATADERIPLLLQTPAAVRFLSCEPLLGPIDLNRIPIPRGTVECAGGQLPPVDWVIAGGESGPKARPSHPQWFTSLRDQCASAGVPFFFKQWGEWLGAEQDGGINARGEQVLNATSGAVRVGKKAAGRLLDGRTHDEYPK